MAFIDAEREADGVHIPALTDGAEHCAGIVEPDVLGGLGALKGNGHAGGINELVALHVQRALD